MVEHYADAQAQQAHMEAPPVQDLIALFSNPNQDENPLAGPPEVWNGGVIAEMPPKSRILVTEGMSGGVGVALTHLDSGDVDMGKWEGLVRQVERSRDREVKKRLGLSVLETEHQGEIRVLEVCSGGTDAKAMDEANVPGALKKWEAGLRAVGGYFGQGRIEVKI